MKNLAIHFILLMSVLVVSGGCNKKDDAPAYYMNLTIDGVPYSATDIAYSKTNTTTNTYTLINGSTNGNSILDITLTGYNNTIGPIPIDFVTAAASAGIYLGHNSVAREGVITITSVSPTLSGTFSFVCFDSTEVTEGSFNCQAN